MPEEKPKTTEKISKFKEDIVKKSYQYPEAPKNEPRPLGAEVEQPPVKQKKISKQK